MKYTVFLPYGPRYSTKHYNWCPSFSMGDKSEGQADTD
jgi:hypothetical protein